MGWFHSKKSSSAVTPDYTGLQLQTSVNTLPVAIVWGQAKIAPNVIWYSNFQSQTQQQSSGGKGLFRTGSSSGATYSADVMLALCEGPIAGIVQIWKDQSIYTLSSLNLSLFPGQTPQTIWGYLAAHDPSQALAYQGTAYVCAANYSLGSNAEISNHNFEVQGVFHASGINAVDADPAAVISDFLTNAQYGLGFNPASINSATLFGASGDASLQTYCRAMGIAFSPALTDQEQSSSILQRWLQICNCAAVWSGGQLKFVPYGDQPFIGYGYAFNPNLTPIYSLDDDDFVDAKGGEDPVLVSRVDPFSLPTIQRIEVMDRNNQYASTPVEARDQSQIELYGARLGSTLTAHEICDVAVVAPTVAQTILQRALYVRAHFTFKLSWEYCLLDPMDIVEITDANLGLAAFPVRITAIEEDDAGILTVSAEELTVGVSTPVLYPSLGATSNIPDFNVAPGDVNPPYFFEPPDQLGGALDLMFGLSPKDPSTWGGCVIYVSADGSDNFKPLGSVRSAARMGALTAALPSVAAAVAGVTVDAANLLKVSLAESAAALASGTPADMSAFNTACVVDNEIIAYQTALLTGANAYNLSPLARGGYGSAIASHAAGAPFMRLDGSSFVWNYTSDRIGQTLHFKFASFNMVGLAEQDLADIGAYAYTITGAALSSPLPDVTHLYSNYEAGFQKIYWNEIVDFRSPILYEIRQGATWATALPIRTQAHPPFIAQGNGQFWVGAKCSPTAGLTVYSQTPQSVTISGNQLAANLIKSRDEQATGWTGSFDPGIGADGQGANKFLRLGGAQDMLGVSPLLESLTTTSATSSGALLHFTGGVPAGIAKGLAVANKTHPSVIPGAAVVLSTTTTSVTLSVNVTGAGVASGDVIVFSIPDVLNAGGILTNTPLYYTAPLTHVIDVGYSTELSINASSLVVGVPAGQDILSIADVLSASDILGSASTQFVDGWVEVRIAAEPDSDAFAAPDAFALPDIFTGTYVWGPWQKFVPGVQPGRAAQFRHALLSRDAGTIAYALSFNYQVQVAARIDHYLGQSAPASGLALVFTPDGASAPAPFNAGPNSNTPNLLAVQIDWQNPGGDIYTLTGETLSGLTLTFFNAGIPVARSNVTIIVEGY